MNRISGTPCSSAVYRTQLLAESSIPRFHGIMSSRCTRECFHDGGANELNDVAYVVGTNTGQVDTLLDVRGSSEHVRSPQAVAPIMNPTVSTCMQLSKAHAASGSRNTVLRTCNMQPADGAAGAVRVQVVTAPAGYGGLDSSVLLNIGEQLRDENRYDRCRASACSTCRRCGLPPHHHDYHKLLCVLLMSAWCRVTNPAALLG